MRGNLVKVLIFLGIIFISYTLIEFSILLSIVVFIVSSIVFITIISETKKYSAKNVLLEILAYLVVIIISYSISQSKMWFGIIFFVVSSFVFLTIAITINKEYDNKIKEKNFLMD